MGFPFSDHIALLEQLLAGRQCDCSDGLERQPVRRTGQGARRSIGDREADRRHLQRRSSSNRPRFRGHLSRLKRATGRGACGRWVRAGAPGRLLARRWISVELVLRACHHWGSSSLAGHKWPPCLRAEPVINPGSRSSRGSRGSACASSPCCGSCRRSGAERAFELSAIRAGPARSALAPGGVAVRGARFRPHPRRHRSPAVPALPRDSVPPARPLLIVVTAFTVAHSITLIASASTWRRTRCGFRRSSKR